MEECTFIISQSYGLDIRIIPIYSFYFQVQKISWMVTWSLSWVWYGILFSVTRSARASSPPRNSWFIGYKLWFQTQTSQTSHPTGTTVLHYSKLVCQIFLNILKRIFKRPIFIKTSLIYRICSVLKFSY